MAHMRIEVVCEADPGHRWEIPLEGFSREYAEQLAGIMDGTSPFYISPPRETPVDGSMMARCEVCGGWFRATVYEAQWIVS